MNEHIHKLYGTNTFRDQDGTETEISGTGKILQSEEERKYPQNILMKY